MALTIAFKMGKFLRKTTDIFASSQFSEEFLDFEKTLLVAGFFCIILNYTICSNLDSAVEIMAIEIQVSIRAGLIPAINRDAACLSFFFK